MVLPGMRGQVMTDADMLRELEALLKDVHAAIAESVRSGLVRCPERSKLISRSRVLQTRIAKVKQMIEAAASPPKVPRVDINPAKYSREHWNPIVLYRRKHQGKDRG